MRATLLLFALVATVAAVAVAARKPQWTELSTSYTFEQYKKDFGKKYATAHEDERRKANFEFRLMEVLIHNSDKTQSWKKGVNHMTDWSDEERARVRGNTNTHHSKALRTHLRSKTALPHEVDYRHANPPILTAVKDQGMCGSCWAHAATEELETMFAIKTGQLYVLSQQQINSCTPNPNDCGGAGGCNGATFQLAWEYVLEAGRQIQEWAYPYTSYNGDSGICLTNGTVTGTGATLTGYIDVRSNDGNAVMDALALAGPLAIGVDASAWSDYESGVFSGCNYALNISIDHAVQLVGYGHDYALGLDYWLVRNSWSPAWGEEGFIRLQRDAQEGCGWNVHNRQGLGCKTDPHTVWTCGRCGLAYAAAYPVV